jgi:hypothetical protein
MYTIYASIIPNEDMHYILNMAAIESQMSGDPKIAERSAALIYKYNENDPRRGFYFEVAARCGNIEYS